MVSDTVNLDAPLSAILTSCSTSGNPFRLPNQNRMKDALERGTLRTVSTVFMLANRLPLLRKNRKHA